MADLVLEWGDFGTFGTSLDDGVTNTVDTGGVAVAVTFGAIDEDSQAFTFSAPAYSDGSTNPTSHLKLFGDGGEGGLDQTSVTVIDFSSTSALYTDEVQNVSFRLNDVDAGAGDDIDEGTTGTFQDNVTILAYDAEGNVQEVTLTAGGDVVTSDGTVVGSVETGFEDENGSVLVNIAGPVSRIEIQYANAGDANQAVLVSDISFSTVDVDENLAPDAVDDFADTTAVAPVTVDVLANDTDPEGDPLTVTEASAPNGTVTINDDGTITYTPDAGFLGDDIISYTITDPSGNTDSAIVTVTVDEEDEPENGLPVANPDAADTPEDTPVTVDVLSNDTDPDGDPLTVTGVFQPLNGTAVVNPDGTITYTPNPGFTGEDTIPYFLDDGNGGTDTGTLTVTVGDTDAVDDAEDTPLDTPVTIAVLANDTDPQGQPLTVTGASDPANGSVVVNADGTITYTPDAGFTGVDTFTYDVVDPDGNTDTATVTVTVGETDAVDDEAETPVDTPVIIPVLANDVDPDGQPLTVSEIGTPVNGGTAEINPDGTVTYTPAPGFTGVDSFAYTVTDPDGNEDIATVTVVVGDTDARDDEDFTVIDRPVTIDVLSNDFDPDGQPLTVTGASDPANGSAVVNPDGTITYTPDAGFSGTDTFTYDVVDPDGNTDTATVTVFIRDGIVEGTDDGELIDDTYLGDPNNPPDVVDGGDNIFDDATGDDRPDDDIIEAGGGDDSVFAGEGDDVVNGDDGMDEIFGGDGDDTLEGGADDDTVAGDLGQDSLFGNDGDDLITGGVAPFIDTDIIPVPDADQPADFFDGFDEDPDPEDDRDFADGGAGNDTIFTGDDADTVIGGTGDDLINAGVDDDLVFGGDGNDSISDDQGADTIDGGAGDDTIVSGTDQVGPILINSDYEGDSPSFPYTVGDTTFLSDPNPEDGRDSVLGGAGNDIIFTGDDRDTIDGGADNDTIDGGIDDDLIDGGDGDDSIIGSHGSDTIDGGAGNDVIDASNIPALEITDDVDAVPENDRDVVFGGAGDDTITTGDDDDSIDGGTGDDVIDAGIDEDTVLGGLGSDTIDGGAGDDFIDASAPVDVEEPDATDPDPENDRDLVLGGAGNDTIITGDDDDTVDGGAGDDVIDLGIDDDVATGGDGSDTIDGGDGDDTIDASAPTEEDDATDPDPENDRDLVLGGAGNDVITTGDDDDTVESGAGDDVIDTGIDDDRVLGGDGSDTVDAGAGDDFVDTSAPTEEVDATDPDPENDRDLVLGGAGNDTILTGDDDDTVFGGAGDDLIELGIDDDVADGGDDNDTILGGEGSDTIDGGAGDDLIDGRAPIGLELPDDVDPDPENDRDLLNGGAGSDTILGGDDDDTLNGGAGDDLLDGGIDDDVLNGGAGADEIIGGDGDDTITGGEGPDTISGGDGRDDIIGATIDDVVDGGSGPDGVRADGLPEDYDTLDLRGTAPDGGTIRVTYTSDDREDGFVEFFGSDDADPDSLLGTMTFEDIENVVPCFTPGTMIATPTGERLVEDLKVGDRVITRDNGIQEIRWIGRKDLTGHDLARAPHMRPILIRKGALGNGLPEHDLLVSPNHRILVNNDKTALYFEEREVLAAAKHLTGLEGVDEVGTLGVSYIHFMFDQHEVVLSNGAWTESFQPGDYTLKGIGNAQRNEILELFPELQHAEGLKNYTSARRSLKKHEAKLLVK